MREGLQAEKGQKNFPGRDGTACLKAQRWEPAKVGTSTLELYTVDTPWWFVQ